MHYILRWEVPQAARKAAIDRFLTTGGAPPEGVTMVTRWHTADGDYGFAIVESEDGQALAKFAQEWNDLLPIDIRPALDDESLGAVLSSG